MALMAALDIGRGALLAYQSALQIIGNNIANVATPGYTRVSPDLASVAGPRLAQGQLGYGVRLEGARRNVSEAIQARLRAASSDVDSATVVREGLTRIEGIFDPLGDENLGSLLSAFFNSVGDLQNNPENTASRVTVITSASTLAERIRDSRQQLLNFRLDINTEIEAAVKRVDLLASRVAEINGKITAAEAGTSTQAAGLRDERDAVLAEMAKLVNIQTREQPNGAVNVYIGNESLVQFSHSRGVKTVIETGTDGLPSAVVKFKDDNGTVPVVSGKIGGLFQARDTEIKSLLDRLDSLARTLIKEVNKIHSSGQGTIGYESLASLTSVLDSSLPLTDSTNGLPFIPRTGSFFIDVKAADGSVSRTQINIDLDGLGTDTSLDDVVAQLNAAGVNATVLADGRLEITAPAGATFTFADDTSGFLAAMGLNVLFTGEDASDIDVNSLLTADPRLLAAAKTGQSGDGANATAMALLENATLTDLGDVSLAAYYTASMSDLAVTSSAAESRLDAAGVVFDSLTAQRESISGVNLDEEAISMISYQRAYEGAARYMNVVNEMLQTLLGLIG